MNKRLWIPLCSALLGGCGPSSSEDAVVVSAASSLTYALQELAATYNSVAPSATLRLNFGATGALAQQIRQGAPVDLFIAADVRQLDTLLAQGHLETGRLRFFGRLVIWCRDEGPCPHSMNQLDRPEIARIAIPHPQIAPYGAAAVAAIAAAGLSSRLTPRLIQAQTARTALRYAETGDADVAFTALSLAQAVGGRWFSVPEGLYAPIEQGLALVRHGPRRAAARRFFDFVAGPQGRSILAAQGFRTEVGR